MTRHTTGQPAATAGRPLEGIRVLDLAMGPMAAIGRYFAELGADVVRIEEAGGGSDRYASPSCQGVSLDFIAHNLGKRAATPERLHALAQDADIVIAPRGAVDPQALMAENAALVILSLSDFGDSGRFADWTGSGPVCRYQR